jgi:hypothetical protein
MLRQAENKVKIEGILSEIDLKYGSFQKNGEPVETVGGTIKVLVEQEINKTPKTLEVPVYMFSTKYTRAGKINPSYESIETVMKEFVSIAACGDKAKADRIRITSGQIKMNEFIGQNGQLVSSPRVHASFVSRVIGTFKPEATFTVEFMVSEVSRMTDNQGIELDPPKLNVTAIVPQYGEKVDVVPLHADNPNVINAIENYWESGMCYRASGRLNFSSSTETVLEEVDFGEPIEKVRTINISEFLITGGAQAPLDDEFAFSVDDIRKAMAERNERIEAMKTNNKSKQAPAPASATKKGKLDLGF